MRLGNILFILSTWILILILYGFDLFPFGNEFYEKNMGIFGTLIIPVVALFVSFYTFQRASIQNKKTAFNERFSFLLEQHNKYHDALIKNISSDDKIKSIILSCEDYRSFNAFLYLNSIFSPYMRVTYHILKNIDEEFGSNYLYAKKHTSLLRSLIRNDILYFIAVNSLSDDNASFKKYRFLLKKYDFFEHLSLEDTCYLNPDKNKDFNFSYLNSEMDRKLKSTLKKSISKYFNRKLSSLIEDEVNEIHTKEWVPDIKVSTHWKINCVYFPSKNKEPKNNLKLKIKELIDRDNILSEIELDEKNNIFEKYKYFSISLPYCYYSETKAYKKYVTNSLSHKVYGKENIINTFFKIDLDDEVKKIKENKEYNFDRYEARINKLVAKKYVKHAENIFVTMKKCNFSSFTIYNNEKMNSLYSFHSSLITKIKNDLIKSEMERDDLVENLKENFYSEIEQMTFFKEEKQILTELKNEYKLVTKCEENYIRRLIRKLILLFQRLTSN